MIGHHDDHGVDVVVGEHFAEVGVGLAALVLAGLGLFGVVGVDRVEPRLAAEELLRILVAVARGVDVADGHDLDVVVPQERRQVERALVAQADEPHVDPVARGERPEGPNGSQRGGQGRHGRINACRGLEELAVVSSSSLPGEEFDGISATHAGPHPAHLLGEASPGRPPL